MVVVLSILVLVCLITSVGLGALLYQVIRQQGRLLIRLDDFEARLSGGPHAGVVLRGDARPAAAFPLALAVGTAIERFQLPDLTEKMVDLEDFRGKHVLLVNWSPQCGFCDLIAPDLAKLLPDLRRREVELVLMSRGEADANRELAQRHGLDSPILLGPDGQGIEAFREMGTPAAYLLDERGKVAKPLAVGADQVLALAREVVLVKDRKRLPLLSNRKRLPGERPLSESRILRDGLKAGTPAPQFSLPDIYGGTISLEEYHGRRVLLVFTDPHCGPCDQLARDLARLEGNLAVLMVGRSDAEVNRRKAERFGLKFPVALQKQWEISKEYGIFATPVAFLIDETGVIVRDVAKGRDEILALAGGADGALV